MNFHLIKIIDNYNDNKITTSYNYFILVEYVFLHHWYIIKY